VKQYGQVVIDELNRVRDPLNVLSIFELLDESFELLLLTSYSPELKVKLENMFPCCNIDLNYNPTRPSTVSVEHLGSHQATFQAEESFRKRGNEAHDSPIAAEYYTLRCGKSTQFKALEPF